MKQRKTLLSICLAVCLLLSLCPAAFAAGGFADVSAEASYSSAVQWAKETGVTDGKSDTRFDPDSTVNRAEALTFLWRASGRPAPSGGSVPFTDLTQDWYKDAVAWAVEKGITDGVSDTRFAPDSPVTRTQMAAFLYRALGEPGKTGEGAWYADAVKWAFDQIMVFGSALPLSRSDDNCLRAEVVTYLYRFFNAPEAASNGETIVLFTSDAHCGIDQGFGYAGLYEVRTALEAQGYKTILVDDGDAIQGEAIGTLSKGEAIVKLMNALRYDAAIPGNHEFDYSMARYLELAEMAEYPYISSNLNKEGKPVFDPYVLIDADGLKIAFVGVTTPKTFTSSTPAYFQNEAGEYVYGFCQDDTGASLYAAVQSAVDAARAAGAQLVYVMGHMGDELDCVPWTYADVIANTTGIDVFLDGHSHDTEQVVMKNKAGERVVRAACGTKLSCIGYSRISAAGEVLETGIWSWANEENAATVVGFKNAAGDAVAAAKDALDAQLGTVVASSSVLLTISDPAVTDASGKPVRMVRRAETNLGDFCADAIRSVSGADVGIMNGGGIRKDLKAGEVTYNDIINVFPFGNELCVIEVTGQQILDALEWGARNIPGESGAFLQVSGMSYTVDASVPSGCISGETGLCEGIEGARRVKDVTIGGAPLDPGKIYTLAGMNYTLVNNGDGYTAFDGAELLQDCVKLDNQLLIDYIVDTLGGVIGEEYADPYGQGRITILGA